MLGELTWGDAHHPALSETKGDYDGRWLFINEMNGRIARIDLRDFKTKQILGPVPNSPAITPRRSSRRTREYAMMATRFSVPVPQGARSASTSTPPTTRASSPASRSTRRPGEMSLGWQILMPPFDYDLGDAGKLASDGWMFFSSYNTERATGKLEVTASQRDRDYIAAVDWRAAEKAIAEGKGDVIGGVKVIDPKKVPGIVYLLPCGKSPHGVDVTPDGKWIIGSGKLQGVTTAFNFEKIQTAIRNKDFTGEEDGIPVLKYESIKDAEVPVGLGPAAHAVRAGRLGLHVAVRGQRDREVEARHLGSRRQGADVVLDRPPGGGRRRHGQPRRQLPGRRSTSSRTAVT